MQIVALISVKETTLAATNAPKTTKRAVMAVALTDVHRAIRTMTTLRIPHRRKTLATVNRTHHNHRMRTNRPKPRVRA